ncbi:MAG TPA: PSD1 and planctomycete cytochrome C domain-containing protein [Gemmataceae bacterium]|nr:PSD1 and planctomycete cytochrome C domain-containing protein [Gemmataceae bacterium]
MRAFLILFLAFLFPGSVAAEPIDYARDIQPILTKHCISCHGAKKQRSSLRLDSVRAAHQGGNSGPALVPAKSGASRLILAINGGNDEVAAMPPKGPRLSKHEISLLRAWIDGGAPIPANEIADQVRSHSESSNEKGKHWAFQPIQRPSLPNVKSPHWCRNAIDRFVLARLEKQGIAPAPEADRVTLLRRVYLDLIGLPPSPKDIEDFLSDKRPDAYERVVERLLASPHYGERWGRHWLDLARYADSNGYSIDSPRSIWKYRDWVIDALNKDKPFDQFLTEQLAGDLLPQATTEQRVATGFHRNTQKNEEGGIDQEQFRVESIVDRVNTTGTVFLGLTIGCCQCHDHKFDPLTQREYYQLFAFFNNCDEPTLELPTQEQLRKRRAIRTRIAALEKQLKTLDTATPERVAMWEGSLTPESRAILPAKVQAILAIAPNGRNFRQEQAVIAAYRNFEQVRHVVGGIGQPLNYLAAAHVQAMMTRRMLEKKIAELQKELPVIPTTLVIHERKTPRATHIHLGGDFLRKGAAVAPDVPHVLPPLANRQRQLPGDRPTRLHLARWLVDGRNPLTARVTVNRLWQQYFGLGIVETENDFGTQGTPPSHPELLDWLSTEFRDRGWSMKAMHRLIVASATYRQSSRHRPELAVIDARNRLLARQNRLRLDAEVVRDVALSASGLLNRTVGGPSVYPPQPKGVYSFTQVPRNWEASRGRDRYRRGLYTYFWRSAPHPDLTVFDAPDALSACTRRNRSNTPLQALTLLNDQGFFEFAQALAGRVLHEGPSEDRDRIGYAFYLCLGRKPNERERQALERLLQQQGGAKPLDAWTSVARVLLNLDEFITRE